MAPRKPPPLDKSLFVGDGPLAPGSAPLPPSPFKVHPAYVIDGHSFPDRPTTDSTPIFGGLPESYPRPPVRSAIQVKTNVSAEPAPAILGVKPFSIHPTILNLTLATPPSITNIAKGAVDIIVPCTYPLTEKEWDLLDEAVKALDGTWGREAKEAEGQTDPDPSAPARSPVGRGGKIVISGLFPPPLTKQSEALLTDKAFNLHVTRLSQLSFHANVYLKALPPVVDANALPGQSWWTDKKEVERVLKVYAMPSIETFGTHRLIYGSSPALPLADLAHATGADTDLQQPISSEEWYGVIRRVVTEIGEGASAITDFMGGNAANVYGLQV